MSKLTAEVGKRYKVKFDDCCVQGSFESVITKINAYEDGTPIDGRDGFYNLEFKNGVKVEGMVIELEFVDQKNKPYILDSNDEPAYNPEYGDDRVCECGHPYYRHFDSYEDMYPSGCKYCYDGHEFKEKEADKPEKLEKEDSSETLQ